MTKVQSLALVCAGPISHTGLGRILALQDRLSLVKAGSLQRASRAANSLGGGTPVANYGDLQTARTILVNVPGNQLPAVLVDLAAGLSWKRKVVLLCNSKLDSSALAPLEALGASPGSFDEVKGFDGQRYVIEGSLTALREMRSLLNRGASRTIEIHRGEKEAYLIGISFNTEVLTSALAASVRSFRLAGIASKQARSIAAKIAEQSIRNYLKTKTADDTRASDLALQIFRCRLSLGLAKAAID